MNGWNHLRHPAGTGVLDRLRKAHCDYRNHSHYDKHTYIQFND